MPRSDTGIVPAYSQRDVAIVCSTRLFASCRSSVDMGGNPTCRTSIAAEIAP
jgi:hypothetical protein